MACAIRAQRSPPPRSTTGRRLSAPSCSGFSDPASWTSSACGSTRYRPGRAEWPIITAGTTVGAVAEGTAAGTAVAATFTPATLKPKRLTGRFEYTHEIAASVPELEMALRRDLADSITAQMSTQIIEGNGTAPNVRGFDTALTEPGNAGAVATYADYAGFHAAAVDGIHAEHEGQVRSVIPVDVYQHAASVYQAGSRRVRDRGPGAALRRVHGVALRRRRLAAPGSGRRTTSTRPGRTAAA